MWGKYKSRFSKVEVICLQKPMFWHCLYRFSLWFRWPLFGTALHLLLLALRFLLQQSSQLFQRSTLIFIQALKESLLHCHLTLKNLQHETLQPMKFVWSLCLAMQISRCFGVTKLWSILSNLIEASWTKKWQPSGFRMTAVPPNRLHSATKQLTKHSPHFPATLGKQESLRCFAHIDRVLQFDKQMVCLQIGFRKTYTLPSAKKNGHFPGYAGKLYGQGTWNLPQWQLQYQHDLQVSGCWDLRWPATIQ